MADIILLCVVVGVPSTLALMAVESLAGWFPTFRSNDHLLAAVGGQIEMPGESSVRFSVSRARNHGVQPGSNTSNRKVAGVPDLETPVIAGLRAPGGETTV